MNFVGRPEPARQGQVNDAPYVVGFRDGHIVGSTEQRDLRQGARRRRRAGARFNVVHVGDELRDPDDGDLLGYIGHLRRHRSRDPARPRAAASAGRPSSPTCRCCETGREILQGDKIFPAEVDIGDDFVPSAPRRTPSSTARSSRWWTAFHRRPASTRCSRSTAASATASCRATWSAIFARGEVVRDRFGRGQNWTACTATYDDGPAAERAQRHAAAVPGLRPHELRPGGRVDPARSAIGDFVKHPDFGHRDTGLTDFAR